jgi:outer membrane receptor for ferrienterochelin and colicins
LPKYLFNTLLKHSFENLILLFCILINTISFAQTTKGTVADGMPLQMANIVLKTLKKSTISTANGSYRFDGVPMGNYEITASYIPVLNPKLNASQLQTPLKLS